MVSPTAQGHPVVRTLAIVRFPCRQDALRLLRRSLPMQRMQCPYRGALTAPLFLLHRTPLPLLALTRRQAVCRPALAIGLSPPLFVTSPTGLFGMTPLTVKRTSAMLRNIGTNRRICPRTHPFTPLFSALDRRAGSSCYYFSPERARGYAC